MSWKWLEKRCYPDHPKIASMEEWDEWDEVEKSKPICNFFVNEIPMWWRINIASRWSDTKYWFKYRLQKEHKYHLIDTGLEPGYYEIDYRMMHGLFNILKDFCEDERPYHDWCWRESSKELDAEEKGEKYKRPKFERGREVAMASFKWQKELVWQEYEVPEDKPELIGQPTHQAKNAEELEKLYLWWVETRPNRVDPYEKYPDTYLDTILDENKGKRSFRKLLRNRPPEEEEKFLKLVEQRTKLEEKYRLEDDEMMIRLISIRRTLWT